MAPKLFLLFSPPPTFSKSEGWACQTLDVTGLKPSWAEDSGVLSSSLNCPETGTSSVSDFPLPSVSPLLLRNRKKKKQRI